MSNKNEEIIEENILFAESIFGAATKRGYVKLSHGLTFEMTITPSEARMYALSILEAADAAENDEFIMKWLKEEIGITNENNGVQVLRRFREMRVDFRKRDLADAKENEN